MELYVQKIKKELKRLKRNQSWLSRKMGISRQLLSYMITSKKITHAERIAKALGMNPRDLIL